MSKKFWQIKNSVDSSESTLILEGPIASETWWGDEVTPQEFRAELKKINSNKLTVQINSVGGDVWAGVSIHDALKELDAEVTVKVSGLAASIAVTMVSEINNALNTGLLQRPISTNTFTVSDLSSNTLSLDLTWQMGTSNANARITPKFMAARVERV
jgi:TATA-box binding protein (TBP) (component of TFIID and TFIIIB)